MQWDDETPREQVPKQQANHEGIVRILQSFVAAEHFFRDVSHVQNVQSHWRAPCNSWEMFGSPKI